MDTKNLQDGTLEFKNHEKRKTKRMPPQSKENVHQRWFLGPNFDDETVPCFKHNMPDFFVSLPFRQENQQTRLGRLPMRRHS